MATIIQRNKIVAHVDNTPSKEDDGFIYTVRETGYSSTSECLANNNAFAYVRKKCKKLLSLLNRKRPKGTPPLTSLPRIYGTLMPNRIRTKFPEKRKRTIWQYDNKNL